MGLELVVGVEPTERRSLIVSNCYAAVPLLTSMFQVTAARLQAAAVMEVVPKAALAACARLMSEAFGQFRAQP